MDEGNISCSLDVDKRCDVRISRDCGLDFARFQYRVIVKSRSANKLVESLLLVVFRERHEVRGGWICEQQHLVPVVAHFCEF